MKIRKIKPLYDAGYPLAIELVFAERLGDSAKQYGKWVSEACLKAYRAIAKSGAVMNTDAADGKDVTPHEVLSELVSALTIKKVRNYLRKNAGKAFSALTRERQQALIMNVVQEIAPNAAGFMRAMPGLLEDGEFGAVPAYIFSEVRRKQAVSLAREVTKADGTSPDPYIRQINRVADEIQQSITDKNFGLTDKYYETYYQRFRSVPDSTRLLNIRTGQPATADTAGAISKTLAPLVEGMQAASVTPSLSPIATAQNELRSAAVDNFRLIIRAAAHVELADGITRFPEDFAEAISIDIYDGDKKLLQQTEQWLETTMGKMQGVSDEAIQRGIKVVQQGLREGRGVDYIASQLQEEMDIPWRRARNVARNETGNQAWNLEYANARAGGMEIYRWRGMLDERERKLHVWREAKAYRPEQPPTDGNPGQPHGCRCFPEWLFSKADVAAARKEIELRNASQQRRN